MPDASSVSTWELLKEFDFQPDDGVVSDLKPGLSFDFGNLKLSASAVMGKMFHPVVLFTGVLNGRRTLAEIAFELPRKVSSKEQLAALLVYYLDKAADGNVFQPIRGVGWLAEGRTHRKLLPWETDLAVNRARPHFKVE